MVAAAAAAPGAGLSAPAATLDPGFEQLARTVFHEAGHAVAGVVLRLNVVRVSVRPRGESAGVCHLRSSWALDVVPVDPAAAGAFYRALRRRAALGMVMTLAGPEAERRAFPGTSWHDDALAGDLEVATSMADALARLHGGTGGDPDPEILRAGVRASAALIDGAWPAVAAVSRLLLARRVTTGREVRAAVLEALGPDVARLAADAADRMRRAGWAVVRGQPAAADEGARATVGAS